MRKYVSKPNYVWSVCVQNRYQLLWAKCTEIQYFTKTPGMVKKDRLRQESIMKQCNFSRRNEIFFLFSYLPTWLLKDCPWIGHELPLLQTTIWGPFRKGEVSLRIEDLRQLSKLSGKPKHLKKRKEHDWISYDQLAL